MILRVVRRLPRHQFELRPRLGESRRPRQLFGVGQTHLALGRRCRQIFLEEGQCSLLALRLLQHLGLEQRRGSPSGLQLHRLVKL
jgi:hypothetical protein